VLACRKMSTGEGTGRQGSERTLSTPAAARMSWPWHMDAMGFLAASNSRTRARTPSSRARYSGERPPGSTQGSGHLRLDFRERRIQREVVAGRLRIRLQRRSQGSTELGWTRAQNSEWKETMAVFTMGAQASDIEGLHRRARPVRPALSASLPAVSQLHREGSALRMTGYILTLSSGL